MTRKELESALGKINWSIIKSHNELNDYIINHNGTRTMFVVYGERLSIRGEKFGDSFCGDIVLQMKNIEVSVRDGDGTPYVCLEIGNENFIQFYNHDKIKK